VIKTRKSLLKKLIEKVKEIHPYTVPEVIAMDIKEGNRDYLNWLKSETK